MQLFEKLLASYPTHPVTLLVDVMEQGYTQQVLPPVSSVGLVPQIERRMKRDLREQDLNNFLIGGRSTDGRKDWSVLFISLAYAEPFSKWLEFILQQKNKFGGVFLLPVESVKLIQDLKNRLADAPPPEWEIVLLHNKTGGFRIITYRNEKLVFARLAQNLIGENIPEVVVGNLEQELQNTFEYLKRLGFRGDTTSKVTIVASTEILEKLDTKVLKFSEINMFSPYQVAEVLGLPETVNPKDKYADVFMASHFAAQKKHSLKFHTKQTKMLDNLYLASKALLATLLVVLVVGICYESYKAYKATDIYKELDMVETEFKSQSNNLNRGKEMLKKEERPDTEKIVSVYNLYKLLPSDNRYRMLNILSKISPEFGQDKIINDITFSDGNKRAEGGDKKNAAGAGKPKKATKAEKTAQAAAKNNIDLSKFKDASEKYSLSIEFTFTVPEAKAQQIAAISDAFLKKLQKLLPDKQISYTQAPVAKVEQEFEFLAQRLDTKVSKNLTFPATISITSGMPAEGAKKKK